MRTIVSTTLTVLAVTALAACSPDNRPAQPGANAGGNAPASPTAQQNRAGGEAADATITAAVNAKLAADSELSAMRINVDTDEGRVVLKGTAPTTSASERAVRLAQGVDGVKSVDNQLQVRAGG